MIVAVCRRGEDERADVPKLWPEQTSQIYDLHDEWLRNVLPSGGSLLTPGRQIWSTENLDELVQGFIGQPDSSPGKSFLDKLRDQLSSSTPESVQLMAELLIVHFLAIYEDAVSPASKRNTIEAVLSWMPVQPIAILAQPVESEPPGSAPSTNAS